MMENMNMHRANFACGETPRWMNKIFWSDSMGCALIFLAGAFWLSCSTDCGRGELESDIGGDNGASNMSGIAFAPSICRSRWFCSLSSIFSTSSERILSMDFFKMPDLFIFVLAALVPAVTRFFSSVILSFYGHVNREQNERVNESIICTTFTILQYDQEKKWHYNGCPIASFNYVVSSFFRGLWSIQCARVHRL